MSQPPPRELTWRAILTGMVLGALLAPCNIYAGLKIGWAFNMSISAALLSYAVWQGAHRTLGTPRWGLLENNINQTTASAAAYIAGSGLVAPIPALTLLTGYRWSLATLVPWVLVVSLVGVVIAIGLRRQMLVVDALAFPQGVATAATVREIYATGREAAVRVRVLLAGGIAAAAVKLLDAQVGGLPRPSLLGRAGLEAPVWLRARGIDTLGFANLGFVLDPSLLMVAFGAIIGARAGVSLLLGAMLAWLVVAPYVLHQGWAHLGELGAADAWFGPLLEWLLWPGVTMMVTAALTSFALSWRAILQAFRFSGGDGDVVDTVPRRWFLAALAAVFVLATAAQAAFFDIGLLLGGFAVLLTFALAVVAGRVAGETGITPIGAMGKVTQLTFGVLAPGQAATNLMAANVTGGAASQCADMLHDLKTGSILGASARAQAVGQFFGVLAGSAAGAVTYLLLIPDPHAMLLTPEWPAPAVATWKAVAEVLTEGLAAMPEAAGGAMLIAGVLGVALALAEARLPRYRALLPSPACVGVAFVLPAWSSLSMCAGGVLAAFLARRAPTWSARFLIILAGGVLAGESLTGVAASLYSMLG